MAASLSTSDVSASIPSLDLGAENTVSFLVTVRNSGTTPALNINLRNPIPAHLVTASWTLTVGGVTTEGVEDVQTVIPSLPAGESAVLRIIGYANKVGTLTNQATVSATGITTFTRQASITVLHSTYVPSISPKGFDKEPCGCSDGFCACVIRSIPGGCLIVRGSGNPGDPYVIDASNCKLDSICLLAGEFALQPALTYTL